MNPKILIIPGNGGSDVKKDNWYPWLYAQLTQRGLNVVAQNMPDPIFAHKAIWLPFIKNELQANENTIIIGHSSGSVAALRFLEQNKLLGAILIGCNFTDLGYPEEKESGYYEDKWQWEKIKKNAQWLVQFASQDDPFIPIHEPRFIHEHIDSEYHEYKDRGHFMSPDQQFPELFETVMRKINEKATTK